MTRITVLTDNVVMNDDAVGNNDNDSVENFAAKDDTVDDSGAKDHSIDSNVVHMIMLWATTHVLNIKSQDAIGR